MWPFDNFPGVPGSPGLPSPGGLPTPGAWPQGVPNPFGLPSPGEMGSTIGQWFSNPYGTTGTQGNQNPWGGINPFDTRFSGPAWDPGRPTPWGSQQGDTSLGQSGGFAPLSQMGQRGPVDSVSLKPAPPPPRFPGFQVHETTPPPITGGHYGGGIGTGILGNQWLYHQGGGANSPWQHVQPGSSNYGKGG